VHQEAFGGWNWVDPTDEKSVEGSTQLTEREDAVDRLLKQLGVPHVKVSFDELCYGNGAEEWMRIFRFLGKGPRENLTRDQVQEAMRHAATHNTHHNVTLGNYEQVRKLLTGTEFESLLLH
jgi:hypothetical protein